jgi:hypothetical protein
MDPRRFDSLARSVASLRPRRQVARALAVALLPLPVAGRSARVPDLAHSSAPSTAAADCLDPAICAATRCVGEQCQCDPDACVAAGGCCLGGWCCVSPFACCRADAGGPSCIAVDCFGPRCPDPANPSSCGLCCAPDQTCANGRCQVGGDCGGVPCEGHGGCCVGGSCLIIECRRGSTLCCGTNGGKCCGRGKRCRHGRCRRR